jgi:hypothetical protein
MFSGRTVPEKRQAYLCFGSNLGLEPVHGLLDEACLSYHGRLLRGICGMNYVLRRLERGGNQLDTW